MCPHGGRREEGPICGWPLPQAPPSWGAAPRCPGEGIVTGMGTPGAQILQGPVQASGQPSGAVAEAVPGLRDLPLARFRERLPRAYQGPGWPVLAGQVPKLGGEARTAWDRGEHCLGAGDSTGSDQAWRLALSFPGARTGRGTVCPPTR